MTTATGYRLEAAVDASLACRELDRAGGDPERLRRALDRWCGVALDEFRDEAWASGEASRLAEVHATAVEDLAAAQTRIEELGGSLVETHDMAGFTWRVMADPEGNEFWIVPS